MDVTKLDNANTLRKKIKYLTHFVFDIFEGKEATLENVCKPRWVFSRMEELSSSSEYKEFDEEITPILREGIFELYNKIKDKLDETVEEFDNLEIVEKDEEESPTEPTE